MEKEQPRPLDICHANSEGQFVKYSCIINDHQHTLIAHNYGADILCNASNPSITRYIQNISKNANDTININDTTTIHYATDGSFNCIGENNYGVIYNYNEPQSCDSSLELNKSIYLNPTNIFYFTTNICYQQDNIWGACYYCNGFYILYRKFLTTSPTLSQYTWIFSGSSCSENNGYWTVLSQCIVNDIIVTPYSYSDDVHSNQITVEERIGLINFYVSTASIQSNGYIIPWAERCSFWKLEPWDLIEITENGNVFGKDGVTPQCGIIIEAQSKNKLAHPLNPMDIFRAIPWIPTSYLYEDFNNMFNQKYNGSKTVILGFNITLFTIDGTIPSSICNYFPNLQYLWLVGQPGLHGTLPSCLGDLNLIDITISRTNISGSIPDTLCNIKYFTSFYLFFNEKMTGSIPECFNDMFFQSFGLMGMSGITGTIPSGIFGNKHIFILMMSNNINLAPRSIPDSFSNFKPFLFWLRMVDIGLIGTMPPFPETLAISWIELQHNQLQGSVSDIFDSVSKYGFQSVFTFSIHDNQFHDDNVTDLMTQIIDESMMLTRLTLSNNPLIRGNLPDIDVTFSDIMQVYISIYIRNYYNSAFGVFGFLGLDFSDIGSTALTLHGCDFYGTLPDKEYYVDILTLHNNRLSGIIPQNFKKHHISQQKASTIILLGQLLWSDINGLPNWIDSPLTSAVNIYYSFFNQLTSIFVIILAFIGIILFITSTVSFYWKHEIFEKYIYHNKDNVNIEKDRKVSIFFNTVAMIIQLFAKNWLLLSITCILIIFYAFTAKYYYVVPYETLFALSFYWIEDGNETGFILAVNCLLLLLALIFDFAVSNVVYQLNMINDETQTELKHVLSDSENTYSFGWMCLYFIFVLIEMLLIIMFILSSSLPENNVLGLSKGLIVFFSLIIALVLVLFDIFVIPRFAAIISSLVSDGTKYKYGIILSVHLFNEICLPFVASIFLLNDCGKYWINLWNDCVDTKARNQFEIAMLNMDFSASTLLTSDEVCEEASISEINFNRCLRSFLYHWTGVMMLKLIVAILVQIIGILWHKIQQKCLSKYYESWKQIEINIDDEYVGITITLFMSFTFSFTAPLIIPLTLLQIICSLYLYKKMINKYEWIFIIKHAVNHQTLPVHYIWIGVILNQLITLLFFIYCIQYIFLSVIIGFGLLFIDIYFIYKQIKKGKQNNTEKDVEPIPQQQRDGYDASHSIENISFLQTEMVHEEQKYDEYQIKQQRQREIELMQANDTTVIQEWFNENFNFSNLDNKKYADIFIIYGFDDLTSIKRITSDVLKTMGINKLGHRKLILKIIEKQRQRKAYNTMVHDEQKHEINPQQNVELLPRNQITIIHDWFNETFNFPDLDKKKYADILIENGFENLKSLKDLTMDDLHEIGIKKLGHKKAIIKAVKSDDCVLEPIY